MPSCSRGIKVDNAKQNYCFDVVHFPPFLLICSVQGRQPVFEEACILGLQAGFEFEDYTKTEESRESAHITAASRTLLLSAHLSIKLFFPSNSFNMHSQTGLLVEELKCHIYANRVKHGQPRASPQFISRCQCCLSQTEVLAPNESSIERKFPTAVSIAT